MSSNGDHIQSSYAIDNQRGNSRYRGGHRRGRGRGGADRVGGSRGFRDRKQANWREGPRHVNDVIDLHDSSQWPSIQESSQGAPNRRNPPVRSPEPEKIEVIENSRPPRHGTGQQSTNVYREHSGRYSGRPRNSRFNGQGRFNSNYGRRFLRGHYQNSPYIADPMMAGYMNGHFMLTPGFPALSAGPEMKPKDIDPVKQVEFYFSNFNLETDFYMRSQMDNDGWVDLGLVFKFKRIQTLELEFEDFASKLVPSENLDIDFENKRVRTKVDPEKWVLDPETRLAAMMAPNHHLAQLFFGGEIDVNAYTPTQFGHFPPMFFPVPGYSGRGGRYIPQYSMYPAPYYGMPYHDFSPEAGVPYYMPDYTGGYFPYATAAQNYFGSSTKVEEIEPSVEHQRSPPPEPQSPTEITTGPVSETPVSQESTAPVEDLSKRISKLEVSPGEHSNKDITIIS